MARYYIEVISEDTTFHYRVELHDSEREGDKEYGNYKPTRLGYDWCNYKFQVKRTAKKLVKKHLGGDSVKVRFKKA